jgi:tRNA 5-methylaminomethyl-2-thiouridine biosynthesis bifunctional protein
LTQAHAVFLSGNGLPARWAGRDRFVVLETGFGLGYNFLATWQAWRDDPQRCARLHFISVELHPPSREQLAAWHLRSPLAERAVELVAAWPVLTHNLHALSFDDGAVHLQLCLGDVASWMRELDASVDAFYLDGFAPARNPQMWSSFLYKACARLAAPDASVATWSAARAVREGLAAAGFEVQKAAGTGGKRDITLARFAPRFERLPTPSRRSPSIEPDRHALIIGGGLAGCAAAWALAEQGWDSTVIDRHAEPAQEASGNPAGLFHGIVNPQDGAHARFNRIAALEAQRAVDWALREHAVPGALSGVLRLDTHPDGWRAMHEVLARLGLPTDYVQALDARSASAKAGMPLCLPAWWYPGGGWVQPGGLARAFLRRAGSTSRWHGPQAVADLVSAGGVWRARDADGHTIASARSVVLANGMDALRLLGRPAWPMEAVRGQISRASAQVWASTGLSIPACPVAGAGYLLAAPDGEVLFGATAQPGNFDSLVRDQDHQANLATLARLVGRAVRLPIESLNGRVGWRCTSSDRLPLIGPVPQSTNEDFETDGRTRRDQARFVPRQPGLYLFTGLGSRGITWAALGARVLAACVTGAPIPLESSLIDAVDPARFGVRERRRADA